MSDKATQAINVLIDDHGDKKPVGDDVTFLSGFRRTFAEDKPYKSFLQRTDKELPDLLDEFDFKEDDNAWSQEYQKSIESDHDKLISYRHRIEFLIAARREFMEDYDGTDVEQIRMIRTPFVTSRTPLRSQREGFRIK